jgi:hypothetical protein
MWTLRSRWQRAQSVHSLMFSLVSGRSLNVERGAQPGRRPHLGESQASGVSRSAPLAEGGLLPPRAAELRRNPPPRVARRSEPVLGELAQPQRVAGLHRSPLPGSVLEGALKRSEGPRNLGPPKVVDVRRSAARPSHRKRAGPASRNPLWEVR